MTGLVQNPAVFERFTQAIEEGQFDSFSLLAASDASKALLSSTCDRDKNTLSNSDIATILEVYNNLSSLLEVASLNGVRIAFDAEQSWYQPALSRIVTLLSQKFNKDQQQKQGESRPAIVYNTYQANLKNTESVLRDDLLKAKEGGEFRYYNTLLQRRRRLIPSPAFFRLFTWY